MAPSRTKDQVLQQGTEFCQAKTKAESLERNGVRYSELLRLPYYDLVRMSITDPMHTIWLGMVRNEIKLCISKLTKSQLTRFNSRINNICVPYDVGCLPSDWNDQSDFNGMTAQQWKNFALIYARPCFSDLLPQNAYESICLLCEIVEFITKPVFNDDDNLKLYRLLHEHHKIFETVYGKWQVSVNYHMALYIPEVIADYGPPQVYWCFFYERMNEMLSDISCNNRNIELQIPNKIFQRFTLDDEYLGTVPQGCEDDSYTKALRRLKVSNACESNQKYNVIEQYKAMQSLLNPHEDVYSYYRKINNGSAATEWRFVFLHPSKYHIKMSEDFYVELKEFCASVYDYEVYLSEYIDKFARCIVNGVTYSSDYNSSDRSSIVKAMFVLTGTQELHPYYGIIHFFFRITIRHKQHELENMPMEYFYLAYVTWMRTLSHQNMINCRDYTW